MPWLALTLALAACEMPATPGLSGRDEELARQGGFVVLDAGEQRAVFAAQGREVAIEPPDGYCLDEESIAVSQRSGFVLVTDCMDSHENALANGESGDHLPRAFPGILTITVAGESAFGAEPGAMAAFESLLGTASGGRLLGRGDETGPGRVVTSRRIDGALYVLIEDAAAGDPSILSPRFWRAFTEINGRLVLVTVSGFNGRPLGEEEMLRFLAAQVAELRAANGLAPSADEGRIAALVLEGLETVPAAVPDEARSAQAPVMAPMAAQRPRRSAGGLIMPPPRPVS